MIRVLRKTALYWAWLISLVGFCLSVFYAEILGHPPCPLCWYQRIALFPLVILLGIAAYRRDRFIIPYVFPIVALGGVIAVFHMLQPVFPLLQKTGVCRLGVSCTHSGLAFWFPWASIVGFALIAGLLSIHDKRVK